jgi:hypothetical protein
MFLLLVEFLLTLLVEFGDCCVNYQSVLFDALKIVTTTQEDGLLNPVLEMTVGRFYRSILMGNSGIVAGGLYSVMVTQFIVE